MKNTFDRFNYDAAAEFYLQLRPPETIGTVAMRSFSTRRQDFGPNTLRLVARLARQWQQDQPSRRPVMIFYDNAQNIYSRRLPTWIELGIDVSGRRSTVMKESFRSTKPITELALNVLYRFNPPESDPDHKELVAKGLIEKTARTLRGEEKDWWIVRFNHVDGPARPSTRIPTWRPNRRELAISL